MCGHTHWQDFCLFWFLSDVAFNSLCTVQNRFWQFYAFKSSMLEERFDNHSLLRWPFIDSSCSNSTKDCTPQLPLFSPFADLGLFVLQLGASALHMFNPPSTITDWDSEGIYTAISNYNSDFHFQWFLLFHLEFFQQYFFWIVTKKSSPISFSDSSPQMAYQELLSCKDTINCPEKLIKSHFNQTNQRLLSILW